MPLIETPNTDPLLDPPYASAQAARLYPQQLGAAADLTEYGKMLIKRLIAVSITEVDDVVVVCGLLRQVVLSLDAWHHLASGGAIQAGQPHIRAAFESALYLEWILSKGKDRWARQLYVSSVRRKQVAARRVIPGTKENLAFDVAWTKRYGKPYAAATDVVTDAKKQVADIDTFLAGASYAAINADFLAATKKWEPDWFAVGAGGVGSIYQMAVSLNHEAEYIGIYGPLSKATHGSDPDLHFRKDASGALSVEPIRNPVSLGADFTLMISMVLSIYRQLLNTYRPAEIPVFNRNYIEKWREAFLSPPQVVERIEPFFI